MIICYCSAPVTNADKSNAAGNDDGDTLADLVAATSAFAVINADLSLIMEQSIMPERDVDGIVAAATGNGSNTTNVIVRSPIAAANRRFLNCSWKFISRYCEAH